ncbi:TRDC protein, partial [Turnix velox]|nr:TRDC protein [Turnix velox]
IKSKKLDKDGSSGKAACLAKNFSTRNFSLEMIPERVVYEQSTALLTPEGSYNAIKVVDVTKGEEVNCSGIFDSRTVVVPNDTQTGTILSDAKVEKDNMLSVAVLGLRILLAKSIAFNTLMSIKLFLL